ncbi:hypothetical protein [Pantanalinema sp. GBBB05]|uniref:hypothetical protein n=1 Tax=Pantanalinema sp. GBBB05 TaxID=2604139 RepID=UPI001D7CCED7|nr:hypothetical protein [Pantanalinema sp. GBBB05]
MELESTTNSAYQPQAIDTSIESDLYQFELLRQKTPGERFAIAAQMIRWAKIVALRGMTKARGELAPQYFAQSVLQEKWIPRLTPSGDATMWVQDPSEIARMLHSVFAALNLPYYITNGVCAIAYGDPRTTRDLDVVVEIEPSAIMALVSRLEAEGFYCPPGAVSDIQSGRARVLSVTHMQLILNADIVLNAHTDFDRAKMARRRLEAIGLDESEQFWLAAPEDIILAKLLWGQRSQSEKQWRDVLGILKVQGNSLDFAYLTQWAARLNVTELVQRAIAAAGLEGMGDRPI